MKNKAEYMVGYFTNFSITHNPLNGFAPDTSASIKLRETACDPREFLSGPVFITKEMPLGYIEEIAKDLPNSLISEHQSVREMAEFLYKWKYESPAKKQNKL